MLKRVVSENQLGFETERTCLSVIFSHLLHSVRTKPKPPPAHSGKRKKHRSLDLTGWAWVGFPHRGPASIRGSRPRGTAPLRLKAIHHRRPQVPGALGRRRRRRREGGVGHRHGGSKGRFGGVGSQRKNRVQHSLGDPNALKTWQQLKMKHLRVKHNLHMVHHGACFEGLLANTQGLAYFGDSEQTYSICFTWGIFG